MGKVLSMESVTELPDGRWLIECYIPKKAMAWLQAEALRRGVSVDQVLNDLILEAKPLE